MDEYHENMTCIEIAGKTATADLKITVAAPERVAAIRAIRTMQTTSFVTVTRITVDGAETPLEALQVRARTEEANLLRAQRKVCPMCGCVAVVPNSRENVCHNCGFSYPVEVIVA